MKKLILKLDVNDYKDKRKALKTVAALQGIDEISIDIKGKRLTVIGTVDPVSVASKLRKFWPTDIISVGPAKEPEKKEEQKKEEPKKEEPKKEEANKEEPKKEQPKKEEEKKPEPVQVPAVGTVMPYRSYYPPMQTYYNPHHSMEENPNECVIC
ncbi:hypothetical protein ACH5RR_000138 [Cinchona calisaya]|uniref:HMA domain-containing protein n=1 Tax=Cinchona calisaya TaxID=153742 RepID=A0ABD3B0R7_9GENT